MEAIDKPTKDEAVSGIRSMIPDLVEYPSHFVGRSENADVWLRKSKNDSEIDALGIEVPAGRSGQTDAILGKFCEVMHAPKAALDAALKEARKADNIQPWHRQRVHVGTLTVTRHPNTITIRIDYD
jgi:hypothetical protein